MADMLIDHWPLLGLRLRTPEVELRWPGPEELSELADVVADGIHDPGFMPFVTPWTDGTPQERSRAVIQHHWRNAGAWTVDSWGLNFVVLRGGRVVGMQSMRGKDFPVTREVHTGSYLGLAYQGQGTGTQMRTAVLEFAFRYLEAETAASGAFAGNDSSLGVSRKLGYREDGVEFYSVRGERRLSHRLRLDRRDWSAGVPVQVEGFDACAGLFGLPRVA